MKLSRLRIASIGRVIIVAFGAQVVAAAMCLMPASAMAATMPMHADPCVMHHGTAQSHAKHACPHCDAPVQAVSQIDIGHGLQAATPALVEPLSTPPEAVAVRSSSLPAERILAPPDSASLIYSTNRRIRI